MKKSLATLAAFAALACTGAAHAGSHVYWSIGINVPPVGTVLSNAPVYAPAPVVYAPAAVVYAPAPVVYAPPPPRCEQPRVVYQPVPVVAYGGWAPRGAYGRWQHEREWAGWRERGGDHEREGWRDERRFHH